MAEEMDGRPPMRGEDVAFVDAETIRSLQDGSGARCAICRDAVVLGDGVLTIVQWRERQAIVLVHGECRDGAATLVHWPIIQRTVERTFLDNKKGEGDGNWLEIVAAAFGAQPCYDDAPPEDEGGSEGDELD